MATTGSVMPPIPPRPRANCTHIVMDYFYTSTSPCDACGRAPALGFLYKCQQDSHSDATAHRQMATLDSIHAREEIPSRLDELRSCGMSASILDQIRQGNVFDPFQIEVVRNQKINMLRVMDAQLKGEGGLEEVPGLEAGEREVEVKGAEMVHRNVTMRTGARTARAATSKLVQKLGHFRKRSHVIPKCNFKCCHACRPYLKDRAFVSLSSALNDPLHEIGRFLRQDRPVTNAAIVSNLGLRRSSRSPRFLTRQSSKSDSSNTSCTASNTSSDNEYYGVQAPNEVASNAENRFHGVPDPDEVAVDGGVALTEEAVETHVPDIITQV